MCRQALQLYQAHPEMVFRTDYWLALIARRLAALGRLLGLSDDALGVELPALTPGYLYELILFARADEEDFEEQRARDPDG